MEANQFDYPEVKLTSWLVEIFHMTAVSPLGTLYRVFNQSQVKSFVESLISKHVAAISYAAITGVYCGLMIYNYWKFTETLAEFKAIIKKDKTHSEKVKSFIEDIHTLEEDLNQEFESLTERLNLFSEKIEQKIVEWIIKEIKNAIKKIQRTYMRILQKYKNCLNDLKKSKNWWENHRSFGLLLGCVGIAAMIGFGIVSAGIGTMLSAGVGLGMAVVGIKCADHMKNECEELIKNIEIIIENYKEDKQTRFEEILDLVRHLEINSSEEAKNSFFEEIKKDIFHVMNNHEEIMEVKKS